MNKIRDNGFENSFFTQDIRDIMDIDKTKIHMLRIADYSDKDKADILKNYMKNKPKDELYITTAYISYSLKKQDLLMLLTTPTGLPVGFLLSSLACNRASFSDFGIQV